MEKLYKTEIIADAKIAAEEILKGGVVGLPTETVYGLAANAMDENAVLKIFETKARPKFNPVIVHVGSIDDFNKYVLEIPDEVYLLAEKFSPGPLTFVLRKKEVIPDIVTAGNDSVALRIPSHKVFRQVLELSNVPLAAPSANRFGKISPTKAEDVFAELDGRIKYILEGGNCEIGIESTVISFLKSPPVILRHGFVTERQIEDAIGKTVAISDGKIVSPGMLPSHYAPDTPVRCIVDFRELEVFRNLNVGLFDPDRYKDLRTAALNLYSDLRKLDKENYDVIVYKRTPDEGIGKAINDRMERAAHSLELEIRNKE